MDRDEGSDPLDSAAPPGPASPEQRRGRRHHGQPEQPVARAAAPDQVGADSGPNEEG